jgi:hypothetical protein
MGVRPEEVLELRDAFGKLLMEKVRDRTINRIETIARSAAQGHTQPAVREFRRALGSLSVEQPEHYQTLIRYVVDTTIALTLGAFEEPDDVEVQVSLRGGPSYSVQDLSDFPSVLPFGDDGWIARYSKYEELDLSDEPRT